MTAAPPPGGSSTPALYSTRITHVRTEPVERRSVHTGYFWHVDLDALPRLPRPLGPFARFRGEDHLDGAPDEDLRHRVDRFLARHGVDLGGGRITAVMNARVLGYVFNPLTVYWCHDPDGRLVCVIAEVHNTYGQRHSYLLRTDRRGRATADKAFYVSPFNDTGGRYRMALPEPGAHLLLDVALHREGHDPFLAVVTGTRMPATTANVLRAQARAPWAPLAVSAHIHAEGIRLWAKGLPVHPRPPHPAHGSTDARRGSTTAPQSSTAAPADRPGGSSPRPDAAVGVPPAPRSLRARASAPVVSALFRRIARMLDAQGTPLHITLPDGSTLSSAGAPDAPQMVVHRPEAFARRVGADGLIGFGEAYMAGDWDATDLASVLTALATRMADLVPPPLQFLRRAYVHRRPSGERNTAGNARRNVSRHYDLSNAFFAAFLDETMTYSSALFARSDAEVGTRGDLPPPEAPPAWPDLAAAQRAKVDRLLDAAGVGPGTRLLEIGTGWGELCVRAAARGARVRSVTLSRRQRDGARQRVAAAGYRDRVRVEVCDYRHVRGRYDAIVSVEMIEAVGHEHWAGYFRALDRLLASGGRIAIQAITMPHDRMLRTCGTYTWIQKYIFPGGFLPSAQAITAVAADAGLRVRGRTSFGGHYACTLRLWDERCAARSRRIDELGFDRVFRRMWHFYLCYSEAGFRSGYLDVQQFVLDRGDGDGPGVDRGPAA